MRSRLVLLGALACGYAFVACGGDDSDGVGDGGRDATAGNDGSTIPLGDDDDSGMTGNDATVNNGDDSGGDDTNDGSTTGGDSGGADSGDDGGSSVDAADAADATSADASDATVRDAGDAGDASDASDARADAADADAGTFLTPTCDGVISAGEYGPGTEGADKYTTGGQVWHVTWNNSNLYIAIEGANITEAAVVYLDVNGGAQPLGGTSVGYNYDGTDPSALPFAADTVTFIKTDYHEFRNANLANGWSANADTSLITICPANGTSATTTREMVIPWTVSPLLVTRPTTFSFFGFVTAASGFIYGQVPTTNPSGALPAGTGAVSHYFKVTNSAVGQSTPFGSPQ
jgi:hypothetical protein